jgi:hypothetical protein
MDAIRINKIIVFTKDQKIIVALKIPERDTIRGGIGMAADDGMGVRIAFEPDGWFFFNHFLLGITGK